ncbi:MAG: NAD(P)H-dependent oxidoreductase [Deferribacterales bacterium]
MAKTLVISGHPSLNDESIANRAIISKLKTAPNVSVRDIKALYPDFKIDVEAEQKALLEADNVVFQFPFFWYSVPGILKEWMDEVLTYGFAHGSTGTKLHGKRLIISTTTGAPEIAYTTENDDTFKIELLLKHMEQSAKMTGMKYEALVSYDVGYIPGIRGDKDDIAKRAEEHAEKLLQML